MHRVQSEVDTNAVLILVGDIVRYEVLVREPSAHKQVR